MRIGFDAVCLVPPFTGIPNYVLHLLLAMLAAPQARERDFLGFGAYDWRSADVPGVTALRGRDSRPRTDDLVTQLRRIISPYPRVHAAAAKLRALWFETTLPRRKIDLYHAFMSRPPGRARDVPVLPVVYDLSFLRYPELHPKARVAWLGPVEGLCRTAPLIHTISHAVRAEIAGRFDRDPSTIAVIEPGISATYRDVTSPGTDILDRMHVTSGRFALSVSTLEPRKNLRTLLAAYRALSQVERQRMPLLLVGARGWGDTAMAESLTSLTAEGTVRLTGYVSEADLRTLYMNARTLFYPSLYEGFGMPITEALALGCPVVVSNTSSMPEAACSQGQTLEPLDIDAWRAALQRAIRDDDALCPAARARRRTAVSHLTWDRSAEKTFALYDAVLRQATSPPQQAAA